MYAKWGCLLLWTSSVFGRLLVPRVDSDLPSCASDCFNSTIPACATSNVSCVCDSSADLQKQTQACIAVSCTTKETLTAKNITVTACGIQKPTDTKHRIAYPLGISLATIAVCLRLYARKMTLMDLWWDDLCILLALGCSTAYVTLSLISERYGSGRDVWQVPFDHLTSNLKIYWTNMILYTITRGFIRTSIVFFYLRLFPATFNVTIHRLVVWSGIVNVVHVLGFTLTIILQCAPVYYFWDQWDKQSPIKGHCLPLDSLFWAGSALGILFDLWIIVLPMPGIWKLNLDRKAKIQAGIMLSFGLLVFITSLFRLTTVSTLAHVTNLTRDFMEVGLASGLELLVGVICTCLPGIRVLLVRYAPRWAGLSTTIRGPSRATNLQSYGHDRNATPIDAELRNSISSSRKYFARSASAACRRSSDMERYSTDIGEFHFGKERNNWNDEGQKISAQRACTVS